MNRLALFLIAVALFFSCKKREEEAIVYPPPQNTLPNDHPTAEVKTKIVDTFYGIISYMPAPNYYHLDTTWNDSMIVTRYLQTKYVFLKWLGVTDDFYENGDKKYTFSIGKRSCEYRIEGDSIHGIRSYGYPDNTAETYEFHGKRK